MAPPRLYSDRLQITLRLGAARRALPRPQYLNDVRERAQQALALRREILAESTDTNACRLLSSEADNLPGILADRYNTSSLLSAAHQPARRRTMCAPRSSRFFARV